MFIKTKVLTSHFLADFDEHIYVQEDEEEIWKVKKII